MTPSVIFIPAPASGASLRFKVTATTSSTFTSRAAPTANLTWLGPDVSQFVPYTFNPFRTNTAKLYLEFIFRVNTADWPTGADWNNHFLANSPRAKFTLATGAVYEVDPVANPSTDTMTWNAAGNSNLVRLRPSKGNGSSSSFWSEWSSSSSNTITLEVYYIP